MPDAPRYPSPDELDTEADALEARARELRAAARLIRAYQSEPVVSHTASRPAFPGPLHDTPPSSEKSSLTSTRVESTLNIDTMEARTRSDSAKFKTGSQNAGKARDATPFGRWLTAREMAASVWASEHKDEKTGELRWSPMAVRAWMLPKGAPGARGVPEDAAKLIAKETKGAVPAADSSWPSGISRPRRRPA